MVVVCGGAQEVFFLGTLEVVLVEKSRTAEAGIEDIEGGAGGNGALALVSGRLEVCTTSVLCRCMRLTLVGLPIPRWS